jgi:capsular exopolysaccharide synthesis family protein
MTDVSALRSSLHDELLLLYRQRRWILTPLVVCLLGAAAYNSLARPSYQTESVISLDPVSRIPGQRVPPDAAALDNAISKNLTLLGSLEMAEAVINSDPSDRLTSDLKLGPVRRGLGALSETYDRLTGAQEAAKPAKAHLISVFRSRLDVRRNEGSPWITATFASYDPAAGAEAANLLLKTYMAEAKRAHEAALENDKAALARRLGAQKAAVGDALDAVSDISQRTAGGNPAYQRPMAQRQLGSLQDQYAAVTARLVTLGAQLAVPPGTDPESAMVVDTPRGQALRTRLDGLQLDLAAKQETLGERHPEVLSLVSQIDSTKESLRAETRDERARLEASLKALERQQAALGAALREGIDRASTATAESFDAAVLMREADARERALAELIERSERGSDAPTFEPRFIQRAEPASSPTLPKKIPNLLSGAIAGLVIGLILGWLRTTMDDTIRTVDNVREMNLDFPLLGVVPLDQRVGTHGLTTLFSDSTPLAEAYRVVKTNVPTQASVIGVTSARPGDGKSTTAASLAVLMSEGGEKVLLIDADLRRPSLDRLLGVTAEQGLGHALKSGLFEDLVVRVGGFDFLPAGKADPSGAARLGDPSFGRLIKAARERYRYVIVDTPPALALADASAVGREVEGMILVVAAGRTQRGALVATTEQLQRQGVPVLGLVLSQVDFKDISDSYGRYYAAYDKYYSAAEPRRGTARSWPFSRRSETSDPRQAPIAPRGREDGPA